MDASRSTRIAPLPGVWLAPDQAERRLRARVEPQYPAVAVAATAPARSSSKSWLPQTVRSYLLAPSAETRSWPPPLPLPSANGATNRIANTNDHPSFRPTSR